jgi:hypothetical protein
LSIPGTTKTTAMTDRFLVPQRSSSLPDEATSMPFLAQLMPPRAQTVPFVAAFFRSLFDQTKSKNPALISNFANEKSK